MTKRRDFLAATAGLGLGALSTFAQNTPSSQGVAVRRYVRLGRTEFKISDISFGSASSSDPALVRHAFSRGINYFDSAESYLWGSAEEAIGEALNGHRDKVFITSKTKAGASDTRKDMMSALEGSLKRLRTDYVDVYFNHAVNDVDRLKNPEWREFTDRAKREGKIRFRGVSGHGSHLVECLDYAIDHDLADVVLAAYSFGTDPTLLDKLRHTFHWAAIQPDIPHVLAKARTKDIGVIAMKTLMGGRLNDMRPYEKTGGTFSQAALRWTLSQSNVDALIISMTSQTLIDEYLGASGYMRVSTDDYELLERYAEMQLRSYCQPACNACETSCPSQVDIAEVLRSRMYDVDYRDPALARYEYSQLGSNASACLTCVSQACLNACPRGVPIAAFTRQAASQLG